MRPAEEVVSGFSVPLVPGFSSAVVDWPEFEKSLTALLLLREREVRAEAVEEARSGLARARVLLERVRPFLEASVATTDPEDYADRVVLDEVDEWLRRNP